MNIPAVTAEQMAEVDRAMIEDFGIQLIQMMENAGRGLAEQARRTLGGSLHGKRVVVLCGGGNNGGGGMVAARHLHNRGATVRVKLVVDPESLKEIPARQWSILQALQLGEESEPDLTAVDLAIDALIGYGLRGDPRGATAEWIERANASDRPTLALDAPSGLDTTSGRPGSPCVQATITLTLALPKTGLLAPQAEKHVGDLYVADIGVPPALYQQMGLPVERWFERDSIVRIR